MKAKGNANGATPEAPHGDTLNEHRRGVAAPMGIQDPINDPSTLAWPSPIGHQAMGQIASATTKSHVFVVFFSSRTHPQVQNDASAYESLYGALRAHNAACSDSDTVNAPIYHAPTYRAAIAPTHVQ